MSVPIDITDDTLASSLVPVQCASLAPPATRFKKGEDRRKKKRKVLHLLRCYTHTHPARAGSTLKGKRKKKADTRRANGQKQRRGGRGTDGPPEPTYTAKRTWSKPKPHDTLRRGTRGKNRDQMGDLIKNRIQFLNLKVVRLFPAPGPWSSLASIGI